MQTSSSLFAQLAPLLIGIGSTQEIDGNLARQLTLSSEGSVSVLYAPFDYIPASAKIVIVGITPGRAQAINALRAAGRALREGQSNESACRIAKLEASFSGTQTRNNLVAMIDAIGIADQMGLKSSAALFERDSEQIHFTSALRYPVFVDGGNYNGSPHMARTPILRKMIETHLAEEVGALQGALWLPLGPKPAIALRHLVLRGILPASRLLDGMPHPSGLNGERIAAFLGRIKPGQSSAKTRPEKLLAARAAMCVRVAQFFANGA